MIRAVKSIVAFFITVVLLIILNILLPSIKFLSSWWFMAILFALSNFLIVYLTTPAIRKESYAKERREYIVSGKGELKEEVNEAYFEDMELLEESEEGRSFININASIVTTKYVVKDVLKSVKKIVFPKVIYTVLSACAMLSLFFGFCQLGKVQLSDVKTIGKGFEKCVVSIEKQMQSIGKNAKILSKGSAQIKKETADSKKTIKKGFSQAGKNIASSGKTVAVSAKKAGKKIDSASDAVSKGGRAIAKKVKANFNDLMTDVTKTKDKKNGGK